MGNDRRARSTGKSALAVVASLGVHGVILGSIWGLKATEITSPEQPDIIVVELVEPPPPPLAPEPDPAPSGEVVSNPTPAQTARTDEAAKAPEVVRKPSTAPPPPVRRALPPKMPVETVQISSAPPVSDMRLLGDGELAGALVAGQGAGGGAGEGGSGGGGSGGSGRGGTCDMAERLQAMVRRDARVQSGVRQAQQALNAGNRAMQVWDGDWVQSSGQEGRGLAGVRQAIAVEIAFAPRECRMATVRGLVVLSLGDDPASPRLALGTGQWRWAQLATR